ncbi:peptidase M3 [Pseudomonas monteilii]|nr:peptidase M3 [Pseudomonas monteilii]
MQEKNPLLNDSLTPVDYDAVLLEHVPAAFEQRATEHEVGMERIIENQRQLPTWDDLVLAVEALDADMQAVTYASTPLAYRGYEWADAIWQGRDRIDKLFRKKVRSRPLYTLYERLADSAVGASLDAHEHATLQRILKESRLAGVLLDDDQRDRLDALEKQIGALAFEFFLNVDTSVGQSGIWIDDEQRLLGLPKPVRAEMAERAGAQALAQGDWLIACEDGPCKAVLEFAEDRSLREQAYRAYHQRGVHEDPEQDNGTILGKLADLRHQHARLLGFGSFSQLAIEAKDARSVEQVRLLLLDLADRVRPAMLQARREIEAQGKARGLDEVRPWDIAYLLSRRLATLSTDFREFFSLDQVVAALIDLAQRLFGLTVTTASLPRWHPSVMTFEVHQDHAFVGYLYLDLLLYPNKTFNVPATDYVRNRRVDAEGRYHPAMAIVYSEIAPGAEGGPALLDHLALRKLFHEFGHGLHLLSVRTTNHLLSDPRRNGTDGVELYGKLLERWVWNAEYLAGIGAHAVTGRKPTKDEVEAELAVRRSNALKTFADDLSLALFDLELHSTPLDGKPVEQRLVECRERCGCWPLADFEKPAHGFNHIVQGYEAGYYAYIWAEVNAADLFTRFERHGLLDREVGRRFQETLFDPGASRQVSDGVEAFLGRKTSIEPFLRWLGIA